jgi:hypothetical protein
MHSVQERPQLLHRTIVQRLPTRLRIRVRKQTRQLWHVSIASRTFEREDYLCIRLLEVKVR